MSNQLFDDQGRFILKDFDRLKPFTSFLPGIAGLNGIPMWVFYVNRGQGISSFGTASKDHAIMEFQPANKAYRLTSLYGFRTFVKVHSQAGSKLYEPFSDISTERMISRTMYIGMGEFEIEEIDEETGFQVNVLYYIVPQADYAALVRKLTIKNLSSHPVSLEILDGAPVIIPFGVDSNAQKDMSRTAEAWMEVFNLENNAPYFKVRASMGDTAQVDTIEAGNFAISFLTHLKEAKKLKAIVDPTVIFGPQLSYSHPVNLIDLTLEDLITAPQRTLGQTPCAFFGETLQLMPDAKATLSSLYGHVDKIEKLEKIQAQISTAYLDQKLTKGREISQKIIQPIEGKTARPIFDEYARQTYLDNVLRGGLPEQLAPGGPTYHVYSRKHGDPERDYNYFYLAPEYYSQGNGNYRDVNQNRRSDVLFYPEVGDYNLRFFLSLIQLDGYNPLVIEGTRFVLDAESIKSIVAETSLEGLAEFLSKPFTPGRLLHFLYTQSDEYQLPHDEIFQLVFSKAVQILEATHGTGFWIDHWTYNLDLLDSFLAIYPDRKNEMLFGKRNIPWYEGPAKVLARKNRYQLTKSGLRQYAGVYEDEEKSEALNRRGVGQTWVQANFRANKIYSSTIFEKLFILLVIKTATLDPFGMGIEMEAGKPGWYDALNGLPGLLGSSTGETYEIARLANFLISALEDAVDYEIKLPIEFCTFLEGVIDVLARPHDDALQVWQLISGLREAYRESIYAGISGREEICSIEQVKSYLKKLYSFISGSIKRIDLANPGIPAMYYYYEATNLADSDENAASHVELEVDELEFQQHRMPDFLEGCVHAMRVSNQSRKKAIYHAVRASNLFDEKLGMYKVNALLTSVTHEVGRTTAFPPGWLENESIWLHMEYKYLLEVLRAGLYEEFYQDLQTALVPFQPVERYGRSPLENSSFIASSAYPDSSLHGTGFVARLSGATAEFLSIWFEMFAGQNPFTIKDDLLTLQLKPRLAKWLFPPNGQVEFIFLGHTRVIYDNPQMLDTWSAKIKSIQLAYKDGRKISLGGEVIPHPYAQEVREGQIQDIIIHLGENSSG